MQIVIYCSVSNYHRHSGLKQHIFIISVSVGQETRYSLAGSSARLQSGCWTWWRPYPTFRIPFSAPSIIDSIQFQAGCPTEAPVSPWVGHPINQPFPPVALTMAACVFKAGKKREVDISKMGLQLCNHVYVISYLLSLFLH